MATAYHIFTNTGAGDPINYSAPAATVSTLTWTSSTLSFPGTWSFGVRAFDTVSGLEEQNLDCSVIVTLGTSGQDVTNQPLPAAGVRAFPMSGGSVRVEWPYPAVNRTRLPTGFNIYVGTGGTPNYASPAATVSFDAGIANSFVCNLTGLSDGTDYAIGVRAYNAIGEEPNTSTVTVTADATGPSPVVQLTGIATS
jgi:Fibronectin type III domain